ncbi:hypothetical protein D043_5251A, partial [Vibrio parahaemolyticus EKP-021]
MYTVKK